MSMIGARARCRRKAMAALICMTLAPWAALAEQAGSIGQSGPGASREEDNRTERTVETLTAQGAWVGVIKPPKAAASQPQQAAPARLATAVKPTRKRVRTRARAQPTSRPLNFYDIRRAMYFN